MPLPAPTIDDRTFDDIVREAKSLIPRYAPEWTDHNDSDPGITLVQLFAWLTELLIYRLNKVPELTYLKFLDLIGIELQPATPARVELTFTLVAGASRVVVPKGTQAAAAGADGAPVLFELDDALVTFAPPLAALQVYDGYSYSIATKSNESGQPFPAFGTLARDGSALLLGFAAPQFPDGPLDLALHVSSEGQATTAARCDADLGALPPPAELEWEWWSRNDRTWYALVLEKDDTRALTRSGHVHLRSPGSVLVQDSVGAVSDALCWIRCKLVRSSYESPPQLEGVLTNTAPATQAVTIRDEVLGGSTGRPGQLFQLAGTPVVARDRVESVPRASGSSERVQLLSLRLEVDEGSGFAVWQEVSDFYGSGPDDAHYVLNRTTGEVRFGDGHHGRIPVANLANAVRNVVAREYRTGGGARGNVAAGAVAELQTTVDGIDTVGNVAAAAGGADEEPLADAKLRAPQALQNKDRAVTADDFESIARATPGMHVRRAKALPLHHPAFPGASVPGTITVVVVPESPAPNPTPNETTLTAVCRYLNLHRLLTTEVYVVPPTYNRVEIKADVIAAADADLAEVKRGVEAALTTYLDPLRGGDDGQGWPFGGEISYSQVYRQVLDVPGVARILNGELYILLDGVRQPFCRDVPIDDGVLVYSNGHSVTVSYDYGS